MVRIMEYRKIWFGLTALILIPGIMSLIVWGLKLGIDFKGGSLSEYSLADKTKVEQGRAVIEKAYQEKSLAEIQIRDGEPTENEARFFVRSLSINEETHKEIVRRLNESDPKINELSFETTEPQVGAEVTRRAIMAIIVASAAIILYIAYSFRGVPKPASSWQFGVIAVLALLHDVLFIVGFYSFMGHIQDWEVNAEFVTAALTVMGFSVHDTIVVFDRLRENLGRFPSHSFRQVANMSLSQTIARSLNTSLTVILVLAAVAALGGTNIRPFTLTLLVGIVVGTYSSIFVATPLLDWWQNISKYIKQPKLRFKLRVPKFKRPTVRTLRNRTSN